MDAKGKEVRRAMEKKKDNGERLRASADNRESAISTIQRREADAAKNARSRRVGR